ncbi:carbamoyl-phosphate synthase L chain, ATP binding domain-containing protein [Aspergillus undulatus]|uniref:carbamoyl-phosphate synthase L chain, ATP binding domain-containing protein n=1 Tax=Aspergillus undulatus TaxID=1810928 RepID=UPI003CCD5BBA
MASSSRSRLLTPSHPFSPRSNSKPESAVEYVDITSNASPIEAEWARIASLRSEGHDLPPFGVPFARVRGGSSSGSGVVVAQGPVPFSLGTDTAGSRRIPAGLNNVLGVKPTRGALRTTGVLPACRTLDCVSIFAQTIEDAKLLPYEDPWVAERYAAIEQFIDTAEPEAMDLTKLSRTITSIFKRFDAILVPTSPTFPTIADLAKEPIREKSRLGTYTNFVNFMGWSAIAIPGGWRADGVPFGITLIAGTWEEQRLFDLSRRWPSDVSRRLGATNVEYHEPKPSGSTPVVSNSMKLAVVGAHLADFPLNKDLLVRGASFIESTKTAPCYQLYKLQQPQGSSVLKPGLKRVANDRSAIAVEVWDMPRVHLGSFLETVKAPLGIGSIALQDGQWVHGFICEPEGLVGATDIISYGGWRTYSIAKPRAKGKETKRTICRDLVANGGEIAAPIFSAADAHTPHVTTADIALPLVGNTVADTYLHGRQILDLACQSEADAVIPGYSFLAENAEFAAAVEAVGLVWIGSTADQMRELGLMHRAREIAIAAGLPVVPGTKGLESSLETALEEAEKIGYPVMAKSTAGGSGIGLYRCDDAAELREAFDGVRRLGQANFGDDGVFIEPFIENARHIEVQVLGDGNGWVVCAGERDCSLQRRNQKVVEETPAAFVPVKARQAMRDAAVTLAASAKYRNVGTVEFIFDIDGGLAYFLEMNTRLQADTRLQAEHPITEEVTGLDLVRCMVSIAMQDCSAIFAKERNEMTVSVYAESPLQEFRPSSGKLITAGQELSSPYDPMLAKLIAHAPDRAAAARKMSEVLSKTIITGVETNIPFLSGTFTTKSLDTFPYKANVVEIIDPGSQLAVQDFPGNGYWHIGVPPSGPMDNYSFQLANCLVGNGSHAAGLECAVQGPTLLFCCASLIAVVGADAPVYIAGKDRLSIGTVKNGARAYVAVRGGIQMPLVMGSRSTFVAGHLGGHNGRNLRVGDLLPLTPVIDTDKIDITARAPRLPLPTSTAREWVVSVLPGPHGSPTHFTEAGLLRLFTGEWTVHYNSNRIGVRLSGPRAEWARQTGGDAGLHPSNIHDSPISCERDQLHWGRSRGVDGGRAKLGRFVVFATVVEAELWKFGQTLPGDCLYLRPIDFDAAQALSKEWKRRQAGDRALLLEFGSADNFNLRQTFHILSFIEQHCRAPIPNVEELTSGVRSIHVQLEAHFSLPQVLDSLVSHELALGTQIPPRLPSRIVHMPLAFKDEKSRKAIARYMSTIRFSAPYLPNQVEQYIHAATFLFLGLGDVYQGSPCAIPLDPRHRLFGTKYNLSRSFTPRGAVGVAGQYLCIYATDSPGRLPTHGAYGIYLGWITFYDVAEGDLDEAERAGTVEDLVKITHTELDLNQYEQWLSDNSESICAVREERSEAVHKAEFFEKLLKPYQPSTMMSGERVKVPFPGRCFRCAVDEGDQIWVESNRMEVKISSPVSGKCAKLLVAEGDVVGPADDVAVIQGNNGETS